MTRAVNVAISSLSAVRLSICWILLLCGGRLLLAQETGNTPAPGTGQQATTVSVDVKVVNVLATVRDKHGKIVSNLNKDDFTLEEDSRPVTIRYFAKESDLPLTLGLLVDTSLSQRRVLDQERTASKSFLDQVLREKDTAFLIHFDREVELLQDLTSSRTKLEAALELLHTPSLHDEENSPDSSGQGSGGGGGPGMGRRGGMHRAGTLLYDAVYLASNELMLKQQGRKALIILSDGVDRGSKESLETAIASAQRADTLVYSVLFEDDESYDRGGGFGFPGRVGGMGGGMGRSGGGRRYPQEERPDGKKVLERISRETGGRFFKVSKKEPIEEIYSSIQEELRNQYSLGFTPVKTDTAGYHKIQLSTKQKDATVQTRDGFYFEP
ncbi:MAG: VWA domain-containing protein [Terriglobales bacterium]